MAKYIAAYYVDSTYGNDSNTGTINNPFKTIQKGVDIAGANSNDGNKIYLKSGTFNLDRTLNIYPSGSENSYLTIQPLSGNKVILDGSNIAESNNLINIRDADYINIKGLEIRNAPSHGIEVINGSHINIDDNSIHHTKGMGIRVRGYIPIEGNTYVQSSNVIIKDNTVYKTNLDNSGSNKGVNNWGAAIQAWNADRVKIINNTVGENYGEGIGLTLVDNGVVSNNVLYDNFSIQLYLDNVTDSVVRTNFIYNTGNSEFYRNNFSANGIGLANEVHDIADPSRFYLNNNQIRRNVILGVNTGIIYGTWGGIHQDNPNNYQGLKNTTIAHNTVYDSEFKSIEFSADTNNSNISVYNNIFARDSEGDLSEVDDLTGINFRRNLWFGGEAGDGHSSTDILSNPLFANPGGNNLADYQLQANSPAIDVINSNNNPWVTDGQADLGALEFGQPIFDVGN